MKRCSQRGKVWRVWRTGSDEEQITGLNARLDRLTSDLGLNGIAAVEGKAKSTLVSVPFAPFSRRSQPANNAINHKVA